MAWTDSIFADNPDPVKLELLARLTGATYAGSVKFHAGQYASGAQQISFEPHRPAWVVKSGEVHILVVAGTTHVSQFKSQLFGWLSPSDFLGVGSVNSLYLADAQAMLPLIPNDVTLIAGHSYGGALAMILGRLMKEAGRPIAGTVSFGAPRPFSQAAVDAGGWQPHLNITNVFDPVPAIAWDGATLFNWRTPGRHLSLASTGQLLPYDESPGLLATVNFLLASYGDTGHAIGTYASYLAKGAGIVPAVSGGEGMAQAIVVVEVSGSLDEQICDNVLHYRAAFDASLDVEALLTRFRYLWRTFVLPWLSVDYSVIDYDATVIDTTVPINLVEDPVRLTYRYGDAHSFAGTTLDKGAQPSANLPSFAAAGAAKNCGQWNQPLVSVNNFNGALPVAGTKAPRGSIRFGGIHESFTENKGNDLTDTLRSGLQIACNQLLEFTYSGSDYASMCVVRVRNDNGEPAVISGEGPESVFGIQYAIVNSVVVNPYITSQVSRKKSRNTLG